MILLSSLVFWGLDASNDAHGKIARVSTNPCVIIARNVALL